MRGARSLPGHQDLLGGLVDGGGGSDGLVDVVHGERDAGEERLLLLGERCNKFVKSFNLDLSLVVDKSSQKTDQVGHGLGDGSSKDAGVKVSGGALNLDGVVGAATKTVG